MLYVESICFLFFRNNLVCVEFILFRFYMEFAWFKKRLFLASCGFLCTFFGIKVFGYLNRFTSKLCFFLYAFYAFDCLFLFSPHFLSCCSIDSVAFVWVDWPNYGTNLYAAHLLSSFNRRKLVGHSLNISIQLVILQVVTILLWFLS